MHILSQKYYISHFHLRHTHSTQTEVPSCRSLSEILLLVGDTCSAAAGTNHCIYTRLRHIQLANRGALLLGHCQGHCCLHLNTLEPESHCPEMGTRAHPIRGLGVACVGNDMSCNIILNVSHQDCIYHSLTLHVFHSIPHTHKMRN